jgi:hypothetical protein
VNEKGLPFRTIHYIPGMQKSQLGAFRVSGAFFGGVHCRNN